MAEADLKLAAILLPQLQDFSFRDTHNLGLWHLVEVFKTPRHSSPHYPRDPRGLRMGAARLQPQLRTRMGSERQRTTRERVLP